MQITEEVQAEIMEILADDQMKHAEFPTDQEMDAMYKRTTDEEIIAANKESAAELERDQQRTDEYRLELLAEAMFNPQFHRTRYDHEQTSAENRAEQLGDIQRGNVEASTHNH